MVEAEKVVYYEIWLIIALSIPDLVSWSTIYDLERLSPKVCKDKSIQFYKAI